jgi:hypothetical protein
MDLNANMEDIEFSDKEKRLQESREVAVELVTQQLVLFEEEYITLHNSLFDKNSMKLFFERIHSKNKKVQGRSSLEVDLKGIPLSKIVQIHEAKGSSLKISIGEMEDENTILK